MSKSWQPIETAPKDMTEVIVGVDIAGVWIIRGAFYINAENAMERCDGAEDEGWWSYRNSVTQEKLEGIYEPTHWIEMPDVPEWSGLR